jgi:hypothetical protein
LEPGRLEVMSARFAITIYRHEKLYQTPAAQNKCWFLALTSHTTKDGINTATNYTSARTQHINTY